MKRLCTSFELLLMVLAATRMSSLGVCGFSVASSGAASPGIEKRFIEIVDLASPFTSNKLPVSLQENWPTWVLDESGHFTRIPDEHTNDGFVQPASVDSLFQPLDLKPPHFRLALGAHVRDGKIRHVMPALDVCFEGGKHRNRGLCSVPRAFKWIEFSNGMFGDWKGFELKAFKRRAGEDDDQWREIAAVPSGQMLTDAIERMIFCLADSAPDDLGQGSHFVNILIDSAKNEEERSLDYPKTGHELLCIMDEREDIEIQNREEDSLGILHVAVSATLAGSESQYLPDVYKPLFEDESLRNPLYEKFKERREDQTPNSTNSD